MRALAALSRASARELLRVPRRLLPGVALFILLFIPCALWGMPRFVLGPLLLLGFLLLAGTGLAVPLAEMRARGSLRLLGCTPAGRGIFLLAQAPVRVLLGLGEILLVLGTASLSGTLPPTRLAGLILIATLGLLMVLGLGLLAGARAENPAVLGPLLALAIPVALLGAGPLLVGGLLPASAEALGRLLPTTWLLAALAESGGQIPLWLALTGMLAVTLAAVALSALLFRWEGRRPRTTVAPAPKPADRPRRPAGALRPESVRARRIPRSAVGAATLAATRELLRSPRAVAAMGTAFLVMLGLFFFLAQAFEGNRPAPVVSVRGEPANADTLLRTLGADGIRLAPAGSAAVTVDVDLEINRAHIILRGDRDARWEGVADRIRDLGVSAADITVLSTDGVPALFYFRGTLGTVLAMGLAGLAVSGTAFPLVRLRERGTLRLLGTTPLKKSMLLLSLLPVRAALALGMMLVVGAIALGEGFSDGWGMLRLLITGSLGFALFTSLGLQLAARARTASAVDGWAGVLPPLIMTLSGSLFPVRLMPEWLQGLFNLSPTTWFISAAGSDLAQSAPLLPEPVLWAGIAAVAAALFLLAAKIFLWEVPRDGGSVGVTYGTYGRSS